MKLVRSLVIAAVALMAASNALALGKGDGVYGLQLSMGTADLYDPSGAGDYISAYDHSEWGGQFQYWRMMTSDYAFTFSAGLGTFSETDKPGSDLPPGSPDRKYTQSSWNVRLGGDRVEKLGDRAEIFFGPGVDFWSGKAKFESGGPSVETQNVSRFSLDGRIGAMMMLSGNLALTGQIGGKIGYASATDQGSKATWWPSSFDGALGIAFVGR